MSKLNPATSASAPLAEGSGWDVSNTVQGGVVAHILRDDGVTLLACYIDRAGYNRQTLINRLLASAGITANETARVNAMAAAANW